MMKIKITNNGDPPINEYCLYFNVYDEEDNKISDTASYDDTVLQPGKSANDDLYIYVVEAKEIELTDYHYDIPNDKINVIINKELETVDTSEISN